MHACLFRSGQMLPLLLLLLLQTRLPLLLQI
jgi:hypothetical protein